MFLLDMRAQRFTQSTLGFYRYRLTAFITRCNTHSAGTLAYITPTLLRSYLVYLQDRELADYSQHAAARAIRAFLNFWVREELLPASPMRKVRMPKLDKRILPTLSVEDVKKLVKTCKSERDKANVLQSPRRRTCVLCQKTYKSCIIVSILQQDRSVIYD